ncbi:MAG: hypothetical protein V1790_03335 [Planctomycetota bacterium]
MSPTVDVRSDRYYRPLMLAMDGNCIYCTRRFDATRGEGDHVLPAGIGEFEGARRFRGACPQCNNRFGRHEQELIQCGPDAIFRSQTHPKSKRLRRRGCTQLRAVDGVPTHEFTVEHYGYPRLVRRASDDPQTVTPIDAMTVKDKDGRTVCIPLFGGMRAGDVRSKLDAAGVDLKGIKEVFFSVSDMQQWSEIGREILPGAKLTELPPEEKGERPARVRVQSTVTVRYFQAIAKIAFHYYLTTTPRHMRGDEPCFQDIREFIMNGGDNERFFRKPPFDFALPVGGLPSGGAVLSMNWCHVLAARDEEGTAVAYVRLYIGPQNVGEGHYVTLGSLPTKLLLPDPVWGHVYLHGPSSNPKRFAGRVADASIARLR